MAAVSRRSIFVSLKFRCSPNPIPPPPSSQTLFVPSQSINKPSLRTPINPSLRFFSTFKNSPKHAAIDRIQLSSIIALVSTNPSDMESKLDHMSPSLTAAAVAAVLRDLNDYQVPALRFFNWVVSGHHAFQPTSEIYNQIIDNLGRVGDYTTMLRMLSELSSIQHCLTEKAFGFLTGGLSAGGVRESVRRVAEVLNQAGGSCRGSGIHLLIKMLSAMNCFDDAIFLMGETARRTSYYNVMIAAKCRSGDFQGARDVLDEMRRVGCDPNTQSYNYLLGGLFKNRRVAEACDLMQVMEELGYLPDAVTFEVIAYNACKADRMDFAMEVLETMLRQGVKPRLTTHAAFIKGYFGAGRVEDAYKYIADMRAKDNCSANANYSLLASLFRNSGRVLDAGNILHEMMEKGLRPNFPVYIKVSKDLHKMKRGDLSAELKSKFSKFNQISNAR